MKSARRVPSPVSGVDVMALPLSTLEGFVLSRADGSSTVEDIAMMVGVEIDKLMMILERLADLGAVQLPWAEAQRKQKAEAEAQRAAEERAKQKAAESIYDNPSQPPIFDASELEGQAEIDKKTRRRIVNAYYSLRGRNFYQLLGVNELATKAEIRAAYFELSKQFHPDAFFGRDLGHFKNKMEVVFKRLTEAYEVLGRAKRRREYDEYLGATNRAHATQTKIAQVKKEARVLCESRKPNSDSVPSADDDTTVTQDNPLRAPRVPHDAQPIVATEPTTHTHRRLAPAERKRAAADRLRRHLDSVVPPSRAQAARALKRPSDEGNGAPPSDRERRSSVVRDLARSLSDSAQLTGGPNRVGQYLDMARQAEAAGDLLSAVNALQLALALEPDNLELQDYYVRLSQVVTEDLARNYEKQARYEEKVGKWAAAALSWKRVVDSRPQSIEATRHAAAALLRSGGDLHEAQKYAQAAVDLQPDDVPSLIVLARVWLAAGLKLNARRELEKAVKLDPTDEMAKNLLKEAK